MEKQGGKYVGGRSRLVLDDGQGRSSPVALARYRDPRPWVQRREAVTPDRGRPLAG